ncbi:2-C-methyl-D-erythritol 2,4-cyclodiphosphate synthase [candidate division WOR-1 bacterium RIFOXYB2_FULL_42_35]|uniref:2-C-methyl-D-erythritol 2,4-cyclodiphosphate synthase n=1 Tax=candidate division WOR-1 bacterium RIFOXYC2_FULL_41_25 TaxID=1802586 RepID=A0A1F4TIA3_UNCSA|nr:MAG: 2-C-methyl-D-erythritol 2,4-cyclodiphosphate synthase [candidate division WOR-1 bacterium RIFOXYA2_FULL_41_14]OGC24032.1 MAG: 2-C-methyl-D-erythritol 2,4-cyclodiphosphate synthase [candidate division WOR-1 bacterium RIFOXYB2_FULL_42_35]OGC32455.1 MAG: 2-C-methyl-D-erythritol 2,4-cyclodiphosphate synthase [candidate division WOR-1 bacterium RIFOXYC2_FULL_41_25]
MQIGFGYDVHKLVAGRKLIIGGVDIPHTKGLLGWSDGDVLIHAIIDALLGAMAEGDIGRHFPPGDERYQGISSLKLLNYVMELLRNRGYAVNNIDSTLVAEAPFFAPYTESIKENIAKTLEIKVGQISVKAKTEEGLGFTGTKRGMSAYAVCLIHKEVR